MKTIKLLAVLLLVGLFTSCEDDISCQENCYEILSMDIRDTFQGVGASAVWEFTFKTRDTCTDEVWYWKLNKNARYSQSTQDIGSMAYYCKFDRIARRSRTN